MAKIVVFNDVTRWATVIFFLLSLLFLNVGHPSLVIFFAQGLISPVSQVSSALKTIGHHRFTDRPAACDKIDASACGFGVVGAKFDAGLAKITFWQKKFTSHVVAEPLNLGDI